MIFMLPSKCRLVDTRQPALRRQLWAGFAVWVILISGLRSQPALPPHFSADALRTGLQYLTALQQADSLTFAREFDAEFRLLLEEGEQRDYDDLPTLSARKAFIAAFWKANDPNPLRPRNDRLEDHLRRREYSRQHFAAATPPYFDDRGKYYLKYGMPFRRYQDPGGYRRIAFFNPVTYARVARLYPFKQAPQEHYFVVANETWGYENVTPDFVVHFKRMGSVFREVQSLTELVASQLRRNQAWQWGDLIKQRAGVSPVLVRAADEVGKLELAVLQAATFSRRGELSPGELALPSERLLEIARQSESESAAAQRFAPASVHEPAPADRLPFAESIAQFRAAGGKTRVEVTMLAPLAELSAGRAGVNAEDSVAVDFAWLLRDPNWDSLAAQHQCVRFPRRWAQQENLPNAVGFFAILSPPQNVALSLQVQNLQTAQLGYATRPLQIRAFATDSLQLSDVQFYLKIDNEKQSRMLPQIVKQQLVLAPYPWTTLRKSLPVFCYFEIYNLQAADLGESYELSYEITSDRSDAGMLDKISRWFTGAGTTALRVSHAQAITDDTAAELIALALEDLANGPHLLKITVREANTHRIAASVERAIVIED